MRVGARWSPGFAMLSSWGVRAVMSVLAISRKVSIAPHLIAWA